MPRALPALLEGAMDSQVFKAYIAIGERPSTTLITNILYYKYDGLELTIKWASPNLPADDGLTLGNKYYIERGITVAGVNHTIKSANLRFDDYTINKQIITAKFSLFPEAERPDAIAGDDTYENILTALKPHGGTVSFKTTAENSGHWDYNFYAAGKQVILKSYRSLLPIIQQKYLIQAVDNSDDDNDNEIEFYHLSSPLSNIFWQQPTTTTYHYEGICWSPELSLFVAVSKFNGADWGIFTSPDGITWTVRHLNPTIDYTSVCWSPELSLFVAVGQLRSGLNYISTSPDGITWTNRPAQAGNWWNVCWSPELGLFAAVGVSGTNQIMTSADGITWTARTKPNTQEWITICWSAELSLFVAVSNTNTSNTAMTSPDGITWTAVATGINQFWYEVCWSPELSLFVAVGGTGAVMTSPDGITWTSRIAAAADNWHAVCWSSYHSFFLAVSYGGATTAMKSVDGITWTAVTIGTALQWSGIVYSEERTSFVVVAFGGTNPIVYSIASLVPNHTIEQGDVILKTDGISRGFLWRDEAGTINTTGDTNDVIHNLGYLESTDDPPASFENADRASVIVGIHLKYKTGDIFQLKINDNQTATYLGKVTEILDPKANIGWRCEIELIERFANTDGGPLPSTIERVAAYTPLVTVNFDGNLDATVNNLQAFADRVDDMNIDPLTQEEVEDFIGGMVAGNTETGIAVTYDDTNGKLNFVAEVTQAELDTVSGSIPSTEAIQDVVGAMVTGNTETGITVTYQDSDGTLDFELDSELVAIAGLTSAANKVPRFTGSGTAELIDVAYGTWTPTITNGANIGATVAYAWNYIRVGNQVYFQGLLEIDTTAAGAFDIGISLPIASNFTSVADASGNGTQPGTGTPNVGSIREDQTNDRLRFDGYAQVATNLFWRFSGGYIIK